MGGAVPPLPQCAFMAWCSVRGSTGQLRVFSTPEGGTILPNTVQCFLLPPRQLSYVTKQCTEKRTLIKQSNFRHGIFHSTFTSVSTILSDGSRDASNVANGSEAPNRVASSRGLLGCEAV